MTTTKSPRRRYALVGTGHRVEMYFSALLGSHADVGTLVALCDTNHTRMHYYQRRWSEASSGHETVPAYPAAQFETMLTRGQPDVVVVTTMDSTHADYVTAALEHGCDVVCEKPLTIDEAGCRRIAAAAAASSGELIVTFNYRYSPRNSSVKQLIRDGAVGEVTSVTFEWLLDTVHGADYFRRWHREKANSGGLLVHKASHHFDLVNWWLEDTPSSVAALGRRAFYGPGTTASPRGDQARAADPFALDIESDPRLAALYGDARSEDGYVRNLDVFAPGTDIEDNMAVLVGYSGGAMLSYSLNAHAPWEGYRVGINGTEGRLELTVCERAHVVADSTAGVLGGGQALDPSVRPDTGHEAETVRRLGTDLVVQRHWEPARRVDVGDAGLPHGGGDDLLLDDLFRGASDDPLRRRADYRDGVRSVLVGVAANRSITEQQLVRLADLDVPPAAYTS